MIYLNTFNLYDLYYVNPYLMSELDISDPI